MSSEACKKSICVLPWMHLFISEVGEIYPCCITPESNTPNVNSEGRKIRPDEVSNLGEIFNTPYMKDIREKMLKGERPEICNRCYKMEDAGLSSHRIASNDLFNSTFNDLVSNPTSPNGEIEPQLMSIDLRLGNDCNLKCRMCSPFSSHALIKEFVELEPEKADYYKSLKNISWYKSEKFIDLIRSSKELVKLHIAGGEPLITKEHKSLLKKLIDTDTCKHINLTYNTNLTSLPEDVLEMWEKFKGVSVMVSLDGVDKINNYIRYPSNWSDIVKNMKRIEESAKSISYTYLTVNTTVQIYNIDDLPELFQFINDELTMFDLPVLSPLYYPQELSLQVMPLKAKRHAIKKIDAYLTTMDSRLNRFSQASRDRVRSGLEGLRTFMLEQDLTNLFKEFQRKTDFFDRSRNQSFGELYDLETLSKKI